MRRENQRIFLKEKFILILSRLKRLVVPSVKVLRARFVHWTKPLTSSLPLGTLADLGGSKSQLITENALLRKPLIILSRQVKRPAYRKADRILLLLLARLVRSWKQALLIVQPDTLLMWQPQPTSNYSEHLFKLHERAQSVNGFWAAFVANASITS